MLVRDRSGQPFYSPLVIENITFGSESIMFSMSAALNLRKSSWFLIRYPNDMHGSNYDICNKSGSLHSHGALLSLKL